MPFKPRILYPNQFYHLIIQSNNHTLVFKDDQDFNKFLLLAKESFSISHTNVFHYALMNTHAHFVIQISDTVNLFPDAIKTIGQATKFLDTKILYNNFTIS